MENLQIHTLPGASAADSQRLLAGGRWDGSAQLAFIVNTSMPIKSMIVDIFSLLFGYFLPYLFWKLQNVTLKIGQFFLSDSVL